MLFIFSSAPLATSEGSEGVDALLSASAFDWPIDVLFLDDAVFSLLPQKEQGYGGRNYRKTYLALADLGVEHCYAEQTSMRIAGIDSQSLAIDFEELDHAGVQRLIANASVVYRF